MWHAADCLSQPDPITMPITAQPHAPPLPPTPPLTGRAAVYDVTSIWLDAAGLLGWAMVLGEMTLDELAPGAAEPVDPARIERAPALA